MAKRFCVFCGNPPTDKNREHVLPQWLLRMTGDPGRVVQIGIDYESWSPIEFDWSSLVVPSCRSCNERFGELEAAASVLIKRIDDRVALNAGEYVTVLDWLDKVRVGLWLAYHQIQRNPTKILPQFHIDHRLAAKDRMLAIYPSDGQPDGLNTFGVESLLFHRTPSCMMLRINRTLVLNLSLDYLVAARCGFPAPRTMQAWIDGDFAGRMECKGFSASRRIRSPLLRKGLYKPALLIFQPIMMRDPTGQFSTGFLGLDSFNDRYVQEHCYHIESGIGCLFLQRGRDALAIKDPNTNLAWNSISDMEAKPAYELVAQVYELQAFIQDKLQYQSIDTDHLRQYNRFNKRLAAMGRLIRDMHIKRGKAGLDITPPHMRRSTSS